MEGGLGAPAVGRVAAAGRGVVGAAELDDLARGRILDDLGAGDEVGVAEPDLAARGEAEELLGRVLQKIVALDVELARERDLARSRRRVLGIVDAVEHPRPGPRDSWSGRP